MSRLKEIGSYFQLPSGGWGVQVICDTPPDPEDTVEVLKASGDRRLETIKEVLRRDGRCYYLKVVKGLQRQLPSLKVEPEPVPESESERESRLRKRMGEFWSSTKPKDD